MSARVVVSSLGLVLLFAAGTAQAQDPVKVAPDHFTVLLENERVRVLDNLAIGRRANLAQHDGNPNLTEEYSDSYTAGIILQPRWVPGLSLSADFYDITVNNVMPGYTRTQRVEDLAAKNASLRGTTADAERAGWESQIPMGRLGEPAEFAAMVAFLASERASYTTGASIPVDGGWIRGLV